MNAQLRPAQVTKSRTAITKSRTAITKDQKKQLRAWYSAQVKPPGHAAAAAWFETRFKVKIRQPSISRALSDQYKYLDTEEIKGNAIRNTKPKWPELEEALSRWQKTEKAERFAQEDIIAKAKLAWPFIYPNSPPPSFSNGWIQRFKDRHYAKMHTKRGEVRGISKEAEVEMEGVRGSEVEDISSRSVQVEDQHEDGEDEEDEEGDDGYGPAETPPEIHEAIAALKTVQHWYETRPESTFEGMKQLNALMRQMDACKANNASQKTLHTPSFLQ